MSLLSGILPSEQTNRRIAIGFVVALLLVSVGFGMSLYSYSQAERDNQRISHTFEIINKVGNIFSLLKDVETSARGYSATGLTSFLEPYRLAEPQLVPQLDILDSLIADNDAQQQIGHTLRQLVADKLAITNQQIQLDRIDSDSVRRAYLLEGRMRMDRVRQLITRMIDHEQLLLVGRNSLADLSYRNGLIVTSLLAVITFFILLVLYSMLTAELRQRAENERQLRAYEAELNAKINQLEFSNQELERFAFVASHDMQEPLRKIRTFGSLLNDRSGAQLDVESKTFLEKMIKAADRMSTLIRDLLNFSRVTNRPAAFDYLPLKEILDRLLAELDLPIKEANARIDIGPMPSLDMVPAQLEQLFANLLSNALKYRRADVGTHIQITADPVPGAAHPGLQPDQLYFQILVADNGIGFDEKHANRIFDIFQRLHTKQQFDGTGIGLAICKRVVAHHRGYLTARSQEGVGSTFVIVLPERQLNLPTMATVG